MHGCWTRTSYFDIYVGVVAISISYYVFSSRPRGSAGRVGGIRTGRSGN